MNPILMLDLRTLRPPQTALTPTTVTDGTASDVIAPTQPPIQLDLGMISDNLCDPTRLLDQFQGVVEGIRRQGHDKKLVNRNDPALQRSLMELGSENGLSKEQIDSIVLIMTSQDQWWTKLEALQKMQQPLLWSDVLYAASHFTLEQLSSGHPTKKIRLSRSQNSSDHTVTATIDEIPRRQWRNLFLPKAKTLMTIQILFLSEEKEKLYPSESQKRTWYVMEKHKYDEPVPNRTDDFKIKLDVFDGTLLPSLIPVVDGLRRLFGNGIVIEVLRHDS